MINEQSYRYLTGEEMKGFGDESAPIDVTRDERCDANTGKENTGIFIIILCGHMGTMLDVQKLARVHV